jgi:uncharacterized protein (TIGR02996 family)
VTDRAALLAAIRAHPDEDTPRLAFADYLDEHGAKADQFQADFIRTSCRLARLGRWAAEWPEASERYGRLCRKIPAAWTNHLKGRAIASAFERGFVGHVTVYSKRFVTEGGTFFAADPIRSVKFATLRSARGSVPPAELFACPHLAGVAALDLAGSELTDKDLAKLAASPHAAGLRALHLGGRQSFTKSGLPALLAARPTVSALRLGGTNRFGDAHARALAGSPALANLTTLDVGLEPVSAAGVTALVRSKYAANLKSLRLEGCYATDEEHGDFYDRAGRRADGLAIAQALAAADLPNLQDLDLTGRKLGNGGLAALAAAKGLPALRRLVLTENGITKKGAEALADSPLGRQLRVIEFPDNGSLTGHAEAVAGMFPDARVQMFFMPL